MTTLPMEAQLAVLAPLFTLQSGPTPTEARLHWPGRHGSARGLCRPGSPSQQADGRLCQPGPHAHGPHLSCLAAALSLGPHNGVSSWEEAGPSDDCTPSLWLWCECVSGCRHLGTQACVRGVCKSMCLSVFAHICIYLYGLTRSVCTYKCVKGNTYMCVHVCPHGCAGTAAGLHSGPDKGPSSPRTLQAEPPAATPAPVETDGICPCRALTCPARDLPALPGMPRRPRGVLVPIYQIRS